MPTTEMPFRCRSSVCTEDNRRGTVFHSTQEKPLCPQCGKPGPVKLQIIHLLIPYANGPFTISRETPAAFACNAAKAMDPRPPHFTAEPKAATCRDCLDVLRSMAPASPSPPPVDPQPVPVPTTAPNTEECSDCPGNEFGLGTS